MQEQTKPRPASVWVLIFLLLILGFNAVGAGAAFFIAPDGHLIQMPLSSLQNSPFSNFLIPGILLFLFVGVFPLAAAYGLWMKPSWQWPDKLNPFKLSHWSWAASLAAGAALIIWITVQIQWLPVGFLHIFCLAWGTLILIVTLLPSVHKFGLLKS